ncbi:MAG: hypothetical protein N2645_10385 [Clostridia bacterium]|nr:hypothetical protein [Clostridia bacterium]
MKVQSVKKYKEPLYPDKERVNSNPEVLKCIPSRWSEKLTVGIALSTLFMLTFSGCNKENADEGNEKGKPALIVQENGDENRVKKAPGLTPPLFIHGEGLGGFGCVSVLPPAFLSEDEAYQVIREEMQRYGIEIKDGDHKIKDTWIPDTNIYPRFDNGVIEPDDQNNEKDGGVTKVKVVAKPKSEKEEYHIDDLQLDGYDKDKKIGFEFVSTHDYISWKKDQSGITSSVESYNLLSAAKTLRNGLGENVKGETIAVFYDPIASMPVDDMMSDKTSAEEKVKKIKELSTENLREQVKDFLNWLKAEGII